MSCNGVADEGGPLEVKTPTPSDYASEVGKEENTGSNIRDRFVRFRTSDAEEQANC